MSEGTKPKATKEEVDGLIFSYGKKAARRFFKGDAEALDLIDKSKVRKWIGPKWLRRGR